MHHKTLHLTVKIVAITLFVATVTFAMMPRSIEGLPAMAESGESVTQASIYRAHCARCHGNDGRSNTKEGRRTEADDLTTDDVKGMDGERMARIIRNGKGDMPAFGKKLSASQIASLIRYVRSL